jgi:hypothetical protein
VVDQDYVTYETAGALGRGFEQLNSKRLTFDLV